MCLKHISVVCMESLERSLGTRNSVEKGALFWFDFLLDGEDYWGLNTINEG